LRWFARAGPLDPADARDMAGWHHGGGFSLDASVRIEGADRTGLERLLRYCARPPPQSIQHPPIELGGDVSYGSISCPFPGAGREGNDLRR
jgi:hypothetical protein